MAPPISLVLGNELLLAMDPIPREQRFKVRQHTVEAVATFWKSPAGMPGWRSDGIESALEVFVGYVMLDAWISNQDRHHENWGALWGGTRPVLLTFDRGGAGSELARLGA